VVLDDGPSNSIICHDDGYVGSLGDPTIAPKSVTKSATHRNNANALETLAFTLTGVIGPPLAALLLWRREPGPRLAATCALALLGLPLTLGPTTCPPITTRAR
jgi:hypothetical protein